MVVLRLATGVLIVGIAECKKGPRLESVNIQEEAEQVLIDRSVTVDTVQRITTSGQGRQLAK